MTHLSQGLKPRKHGASHRKAAPSWRVSKDQRRQRYG
jgi:hypothetical protein